MPIEPRFLQELAKLLQGADVSAARAGELAIELERLNGTVRSAAASLDFDAEPSTFLALLGSRAR